MRMTSTSGEVREHIKEPCVLEIRFIKAVWRASWSLDIMDKEGANRTGLREGNTKQRRLAN